MNNVIGEGRFGNKHQDAMESAEGASKQWVEGPEAIDQILQIVRKLETTNQNGANHEGYRRIINLVAESRYDGLPEDEVRNRLDHAIARHAMLLEYIRRHSQPRISDLPTHEPPYGGMY